MKLSKNLSLSEVLVSQTAKRLGISNNPTEEHLENLKDIAISVFQPIREHFNTAIYVSSGYRSLELNSALSGSSKTSAHMRGKALDLDADVYKGVTNAEIFYYIKENLVFDKLIWEAGNENEPDWVHVSFSRGNNRNRVLRMVREDGNPNKPKYSLF